MNKLWKQGFVMAAFFVFVFLAVNQSSNIAHYIAAVQWGSLHPDDTRNTFYDEGDRIDPNALKPEQKRLYDRIVREAERLRIDPVDAKIDPVWKAIPGLNGREVDIDRTFVAASRQKMSEEIPLVFREVPPNVSLDDLGAHPVYKGNPNKPMVSLMINVAWKEENIPSILETLREENVKATFFFLGSWLRDHPDIAKQIAAEGHELSNHAFSHANMSGLSDERARQEIIKTQTLLKETLGVDNRLFAPPSGDFDEDTVRIARELGLRTVLWTLDTVDWKEPPPEMIIRKISARVAPGSLILMHPTNATKNALKSIIRHIKRKDLALGTVSQTLSPERIPMVETPPGF